MNTQELEELVTNLRRLGVTTYKDSKLGIELDLRVGADLPPVCNPAPAPQATLPERELAPDELEKIEKEKTKAALEVLLWSAR